MTYHFVPKTPLLKSWFKRDMDDGCLYEDDEPLVDNLDRLMKPFQTTIYSFWGNNCRKSTTFLQLLGQALFGIAF